MQLWWVKLTIRVAIRQLGFATDDEDRDVGTGLANTEITSVTKQCHCLQFARSASLASCITLNHTTFTNVCDFLCNVILVIHLNLSL